MTRHCREMDSNYWPPPRRNSLGHAMWYAGKGHLIIFLAAMCVGTSVQLLIFTSSSCAHHTAPSAGIPCTAFAYISTMIYLVMASADARPGITRQPSIVRYLPEW